MIPQEELDNYRLEMIKEDEQRVEDWNKVKEELKDLIEPKYFDFAESQETYSSEGYVNIIEVKERNQGYKNYPHCREFGTSDTRLYMKHDDYVETMDGKSKYEGEAVEYWVWQMTGYICDSYSGFLLLPMLDGRYWKIAYSC
jgi:hypothetical protein